jgi:gluconate 5-dehydrogenase
MTPVPGSDRLFRLDGRVAVVTGATSGLGFEIASGLAAFGATVALHGRDADRVARCVTEIPGARPLVFDLRDLDAMRTSLASLTAEVGHVDVLVCNAGIRDRQTLLETSVTTLREILETNLVANFALARLIVPRMMERREGRIIFVTSTAAQLGAKRGSTYAASKGGLASLARSLAVELGAYNICVNAISPGYFATQYNEGLVRDAQVSSTVIQRVPLGRWGVPAELVGAAVFLASDGATYVSGQTIVVDGGLSIAT